MSRKQRLSARNQKVRDQFNDLCTKHPQWRFDALVQKVAEDAFLSTRTIEAIIRGEGTYAT